ncbi:MAG: hypothetical protein ABSF69_25930, partial [Polyangiaceae bacterium]
GRHAPRGDLVVEGVAPEDSDPGVGQGHHLLNLTNRDVRAKACAHYFFTFFARRRRSMPRVSRPFGN